MSGCRLKLVLFPLSRRPIRDAACVRQLLSLFSQFASGLEIIRTSVQETFSSKSLFVLELPFLQVRGTRNEARVISRKELGLSYQCKAKVGSY